MTRSRDVANIDTILTAKGDIYAASAAYTPDRLAVGANGTVLTADSATSTGVKWATPSSGSLVLITTLNPSSVTGINADNVFTSTYDNYSIQVTLEQSANSVLFAQLRSSGSTLTTSTYIFDTSYGTASTSQTSWTISDNTGGSGRLAADFRIYNPALSRKTYGLVWRMADDNQILGYGLINTNATAYDGFRIAGTSGNITGEIRVYGLVN